VLKVEIEKRDDAWLARLPDVPDTASYAPTRDAAIAETLRKVASKLERHELPDLLASNGDRFWIVEVKRHGSAEGARPHTGAALLDAWRSLPRLDPEWADAVEDVVRSQPTIASEHDPWR